MDVKYVTKGQKGKTCADCKVFESTGDGMGKCFGHEVLAAGSCNMFTAKVAKSINMKQLPLGYCGLDCEKCPVFVAKKNNDDALREKTAREFTSLYSEYMDGRTIKPEDVNCNGCQATGGFFIGCTTCVIRKCAQEKKLDTCAKCAEYLTCDMLNGFYSQPQNQPARDNLNKMRNNS